MMSNIKKIYRNINKHLIINFIKIINPFFQKIGIYLLPRFSELKKYKLTYAKKTRRYLIKNENKSFNKFFIDSSLSNTELCLLGKKYPTNKSPLNEKGHRSGFTGIYTILFANLKNKKINIAEIGIEENSSTKIWRKYFENSKIYAFEFDKKKIIKAKKNKLKNTFYFATDVSKREIIKKSFSKTKSKFDIIIDDSTHIFEHQINIIKETYKFLKKDGILIIEDIYKYVKKYNEYNYYNELNYLRKEFNDIFFIESINYNNFNASWRNEKVLVFIKK
ncbi:methyltransferase domain-containing protein [Candidatus Pelagibacter bacterium]|jgi:SAM-dependent methyltransferase|nr:methyltransferase domain-containing protein [Candidatus Pelagibacter bacterium]